MCASVNFTAFLSYVELIYCIIVFLTDKRNGQTISNLRHLKVKLLDCVDTGKHTFLSAAFISLTLTKLAQTKKKKSFKKCQKTSIPLIKDDFHGRPTQIHQTWYRMFGLIKEHSV